MTGSVTTGSLDELESVLETAIEELEETESELSKLSEWTNETKHRLGEMSAHDRNAISTQASELKSELRIVDTPGEIIQFGDKLRDSFAKPVEQSAVQGFEDVINILGVDIPQDRIAELRETVKDRTSIDLQDDAEDYTHAISMIESEPDLTVELIAADIENDETRYLIGPGRELLPLIEDVLYHRETLESIERVFQSASDWAPANLTTISENKYYYKDLGNDVPIEGIREEVEVITEKIADIEVPIDIASIAQSSVATRFEELSLTEYQSELNEVSKRITTFSNSVQETLLIIRDITALKTTPNSIANFVENLSDHLSQFYANEHSSLQNLLAAARDVEDNYEKLVEKVIDELNLLKKMHEQISESEKLTGMPAPSIETSPSEFNLQTVKKGLETAFQVITTYREWINTAFEQLSDEFSGEEVSTLFERLYTERNVSLSSVNLDALRELQDTVPIAVSLQQ